MSCVTIIALYIFVSACCSYLSLLNGVLILTCPDFLLSIYISICLMYSPACIVSALREVHNELNYVASEFYPFIHPSI